MQGRWIATTFLAVCAAGFAACGPTTTLNLPKSAETSKKNRAGTARPQLVILLVIDQLGSDTFARLRPYFQQNGLFRQLMTRGWYMPRAVYPYATTMTAPGHSALSTGGSPRETGVWSNVFWDREASKVVRAEEQGDYPVFSTNGVASPMVLRRATVGDLLRNASPASRVVAVSLKARAAILMGGKRANLAVWYDPSASVMTTSSYYAAALPTWLQRFNRSHPPSRYFRPWSCGLSADLRAELGADARQGEGGWLGLGNRFPHDLSKTDEPSQALSATPHAAEYLLDAAMQAVRELDLGQHSATDLLAVSISSTDYAGHIWGPYSWEYADHLLRVDRMLGRFLRQLDARGRTAVVLSSDHGAAQLPERARAHGKRSTRVDDTSIAATIRQTLQRLTGDGETSAVRVMMPHVYLPTGVRTEVRKALIGALEEHANVHRVFDVASLASAGAPTEPVARSVYRSVGPDSPFDLYVVPAPYAVLGRPQGLGTSHGTPWSYDREVPILVRGPGINPGIERLPGSIDVVANRLSSFLGID